MSRLVLLHAQLMTAYLEAAEIMLRKSQGERVDESLIRLQVERIHWLKKEQEMTISMMISDVRGRMKEEGGGGGGPTSLTDNVHISSRPGHAEIFNYTTAQMNGMNSMKDQLRLFALTEPALPTKID